MRVSCTSWVNHLQNCGIDLYKDVGYEGCRSITPKNKQDECSGRSAASGSE